MSEAGVLLAAGAEVLQREGLVREGGVPLADDIVAEADRLGRLVEDLLTLAAADARGLTVALAPVDLAALARETARNAAALAANRGVSISVDAERPVAVVGDHDRLIQLALILIDNAITHSPRGGVVTVAAATSGRRATLVVSDQGPGVPEADRARIFEPFTRLPAGRQERTPGAGLGLAIGARIAEAHGGGIAVDDAPGGCARFTLALPVSGGQPD